MGGSFGGKAVSGIRRHPVQRFTRTFAGVAVIATAVIGTGGLLGVASSVSEPASAGADTPSFTVTCPNVEVLGTLQLPTTITGSIPYDIPDGTTFSLSNYQWNVTVPANATSELLEGFPVGSPVTAGYNTTINATGATPASQSETLTLNGTLPASGTFVMSGTVSSPPSFTGTGASVSITPGQTLSGFRVTVNGSSEPPVSCTTPNNPPVIAYAPGANGPYSYITDPGANTITPIDTATGTADTAFPFSDYEPGAIAITPDGSTAYVAAPEADAVSDITPVITSTNTVGNEIATPDPVSALAITPDGTMAYAVSPQDDAVDPVDLAAPPSAGATIPIGPGTETTAIAITPDGSTALVVDSGTGTVTPVALTDPPTVGNPITVGSDPSAIAVTPDGMSAYVVNSGDGTVTPINIVGMSAGSPITVGIDPTAIAITPDGSTAYVVNSGDGTVSPIAVGSPTAGMAIQVGSDPSGIAITPDSSTAYVTNEDSDNASLINTSTGDVSTSIAAGDDPLGIVITPDQGPTASLTVNNISGATAYFDASQSSAGTSPILSYAWNFGDGSTDMTSSPLDMHTYSLSGTETFTVSVTETDQAGASTTQVFTGQTMSLDGSAAATASKTVTVSTTDCGDQISCAVQDFTVPAVAGAPAQTINVSAPAPGQASQELTVSSAIGELGCSAKKFTLDTAITSYDTTGFTPTSNVTVTDLVAGTTSAAGVKVCFEGTGGTAKYLKGCPRSGVVTTACASLAVVDDDGVDEVQATIQVAPGDPRFRISGVPDTVLPDPTSVSSKGVIGKTVTIKGTDLLDTIGQNGTTLLPTTPMIGFTSSAPDGSAVGAIKIISVTSAQIVVTVPDGSATGDVFVDWPNAEAYAPIKIT